MTGAAPPILADSDLRTAAGLRLLARGVVDGALAGVHRSAGAGGSAEFRHHRPYVPGDDLRSLDWKTYAKSDRFFVREFEDESALRASVLLDTSGSMAYAGQRGGPSKLAHAARLAACLCHLLLRQRDAVGLVTFDAVPVQAVPARSAPSHLDALLTALASTQPGGEGDVGRAIERAAERLPGRGGFVAIFSDCFGDVASLVRGLGRLRASRHEVVVFHVLHPDEIDFPFADAARRFDDLERPGRRRDVDAPRLRDRYLARLAEFQADLRRGCAKARVDLIAATTDQPHAATLRAYLASRRNPGRAAL